MKLNIFIFLSGVFSVDHLNINGDIVSFIWVCECHLIHINKLECVCLHQSTCFVDI